MRPIAFALSLMIACGWAAPSQAQWWGGGWGRSCFGACRFGPAGGGWAGPRRFVVMGFAPRPAWSGLDAAGSPRFGPGAWWWERMMWRREMRRRRFAAWRRWAEAGVQAAPTVIERPRIRRWTRWQSPQSLAAPTRPEPPREQRRAVDRPEAAVAMFPTGALRAVRPRTHAALRSRVLVAAAMLRRPAVPVPPPMPVVPAALRVPEPPTRPALHAVPRAIPAPVVRAAVRPAALRSQPGTPRVAPAPVDRSVPTPPPPAGEPAGGAPADVPVAPLD